MQTMLGEEGTEQFTVESIVDGKTIEVHPIHDPFIHTTVGLKMSRWSHFKGIFAPPLTKVQVVVRGSEGAQRAIMTMDPIALEADTEDILEYRRHQYESGGVCGDAASCNP